MAKDMVATVAEAVHKIQLALLDGIKDESHLFAAGSLMSRSDYSDVVTERSIANQCGYPLCSNELPSEPSKKGHYRVSLKEHKVYDLHETYLYCGSKCLINSRAFAGSLDEERCSSLNVANINGILRLFEGVGVENGEEEVEGRAKAKLVIEEKEEVRGGEVSSEEWMGDFNAIEGYVPHRDRRSKSSKKGSGPSNVLQNKIDFEVAVKPNEKGTGSEKFHKRDKSARFPHSESLQSMLDEMDFTSTIIMNDEYAVSKKSDGGAKRLQSGANEGLKQKRSGLKNGKDSFLGSMDFMSTIITEDEYSVSKWPSSQVISDTDQVAQEFLEKLDLADSEKQFKHADQLLDRLNDVPESSKELDDDSRSCHHVDGESSSGQVVQSRLSTAKSSLRTCGSKKMTRSVTWADNKSSGTTGGNLCEFSDSKKAKEGPTTASSKGISNGGTGGNLCEFSDSKISKEGPSSASSKGVEEDEDSQRFASAEACARALSQAAEAVASGQSDAADAVSEAGITVLPHPEDEKEHLVEDDTVEDTETVKWPKKPGNLDSDALDSDSSWFDTPPEGFSLTLSPFATMWNALFSWMTSSSLAYIYGRDDSVHEEYMSVNGREYPSKVVLPDGCSSEIKQTLAGCLARALPGLISDLKLPTPVSTMEQGLARLLDTMSFMDALPPFRMRQWQVIVLLLIDALSVCRIPGLTPHLTSRRILIPKLLNGAQVSSEEYEIMKDLVIPLGRVPQFSMQSGG